MAFHLTKTDVGDFEPSHDDSQLRSFSHINLSVRRVTIINDVSKKKSDAFFIQ